MDLIEFARGVESGSISLESAKSRLNVSNEQLPYLKDNNGMDLLQIAIKNNYMNLFKEIIKGINIKDRNISEGKMYAQVGGEPVTKKPRYVYSSQHIDLFSKFDLFRDDNYGQCALAYALVNNHEMFYKLIELSKDKRIENITLNSPTKGNNISIINYLLKKYISGESRNIPGLDDAIISLVKRGNITDQIDKENLDTLINSYLRLKDSKETFQILNEIMKNLSLEKANEVWKVVMEVGYKDGLISHLPIEHANRLLNIQEQLISKNVTISKEEAEILNKTRLFVDGIESSRKGDEFATRYNELFRFNDSNIETFINKPSNVLKAKLGEDYKEVLKEKIGSHTPSKEMVKKTLKCKWDNLDSEARISLFETLGSDIFQPNEDGHTIFSELSSQEIVKLFEHFTPELTNEAIYDITSKNILQDFNNDISHTDGIMKLYDAVCNYVPKTDAENFYKEMNGRYNHLTTRFFDFESSGAMNFPKVVLKVQQGELNPNTSERSGGYGEKLEKIKTLGQKKEETEKEKGFLMDVQKLVEENKRLQEENAMLKARLVNNNTMTSQENVNDGVHK